MANGEMVPIVAKNIQSAVARLTNTDFYSDDDIDEITITKK